MSIQTKYGMFRLRSLPLVEWPSRAEQLSQSQPKVTGQVGDSFDTLHLSQAKSPYSEHLKLSMILICNLYFMLQMCCPQ